MLSPKKTIALVNDRFQANHKEMIENMHRDPLEQLAYIEFLLDMNEKHIIETIKNYSLQSTNASEAKNYIEFLKLHLSLCCQHKKHKVLSIVEKMVKNSSYPIEDCLEICSQFN
jgi:hypothetical protein